MNFRDTLSVLLVFMIMNTKEAVKSFVKGLKHDNNFVLKYHYLINLKWLDKITKFHISNKQDGTILLRTIEYETNDLFEVRFFEISPLLTKFTIPVSTDFEVTISYLSRIDIFIELLPIESDKKINSFKILKKNVD